MTLMWVHLGFRFCLANTKRAWLCWTFWSSITPKTTLWRLRRHTENPLNESWVSCVHLVKVLPFDLLLFLFSRLKLNIIPEAEAVSASQQQNYGLHDGRGGGDRGWVWHRGLQHSRAGTTQSDCTCEELQKGSVGPDVLTVFTLVVSVSFFLFFCLSRLDL